MEPERIFKRKIYDRLLKWKQESNGKTALLIEGARRIGKSTIVEEFAKNTNPIFSSTSPNAPRKSRTSSTTYPTSITSS